MDQVQKILSAVFVIVAVSIGGVSGYATVSGTVFCDQCKDGGMSPFDYPVSGVKVKLSCGDGSGEGTMTREEMTNYMGGYMMRFDGVPDLTSCHVQVQPSENNNGGCGASAAGPPRRVWLTFSLFNMLVYAVDPLLSQPSRPVSFCHTSNPVPTPTTPAPISRSPPAFRFPPLPPWPRFPPLPHLPPMPLPSSHPSACTCRDWMKVEHRCYWRPLNPDMKVAFVFGPLAASRYGNDMTLWQGLQGRGDAHKTLLREATTSLLNSYHNLQFQYNPASVISHTNYALIGSQRTKLMTALRFIRANSGNASITCNFTPCK